MAKIVCKTIEHGSSQISHVHAHAHITIPMNSEVYLTYNDCELTLSVDEIAFVPPNCFHSSICKGDVLNINIPSEMIKKSDLALLQESPVLNIKDSLKPLITLIKNEISINEESDSIRYLFYYLYDKFVSRSNFKSMKYILDNFTENISINELAEMENYNACYYSEWFMKKTGIHPSRYIQKLRIEKSKELLLSTRYQIIDIANQVGYQNSSSFTRAFKSFTGISPREFRLRNKNYFE